MHIHLDPVGGMAGDMFVAAVTDAWPELQADILDNVGRLDLGPGVEAKFFDHEDLLRGRRFAVSDPEQPRHRSYRSIVELMSAAGLDSHSESWALEVLGRLAAAEAAVHGTTVEEVVFHEIGATDSIVDVVAAGTAISRLEPASWSVGSLPLGSGEVDTAHGVLPVPAPAVTELLRGRTVHSDGVAGERVTPTGAAIVQALDPADGPPGDRLRISRTGIGFGSRRLTGRPNILRLLVLEPAVGRSTDRVGVVEFEIDDQTPEDLAAGLDRLRALEGVIDVRQRPALGKKGRILSEVAVLTAEGSVGSVAEACLSETSTIGLRYQIVDRIVLERSSQIGPDGVRTKAVTRPDGTVSVKAEMDDLSSLGDHQARERARRLIEEALDVSAGRPARMEEE